MTASVHDDGTRPMMSAWGAVMAAALSTFSVVTTEMLPVGLLTPIAAALNISQGMAGWTMSLPAFLAALFSPCVVILAGSMDRRTLLWGLLALLIVANVMSAMADTLVWMLIARSILGACIGGIWAIVGGLAVRLVDGPKVGVATSIIFGGVAAASVLGIPLGTFLGDLLGWRWAFVVMAVFSGAVLAMHVVLTPRLPVEGAITLHHFIRQLQNGALVMGLALTGLLVAGHFTAFTFVRPLLQDVSGFDAQWIGGLLLAYGVAGIMGNFVVGLITAHRVVLGVFIIALGLFITPILFLTLGQSLWGGASSLMVWGLAYGGVSVGLMTWVMKAAPEGVEIASALYASVFNIAIALGAWLGGVIIDQARLEFNLGLAMLCAGLSGALILVHAIRIRPKLS